MRVSVHGADGLVERGHLGNLPSDAFHQQAVHFIGGQAVNAGQQVVRGIVQEPGTAVAIHAAVARQQRAVGLRNHAQSVRRLDLLGRAMVRQHLFVGQQLPAKHGIGQRRAIERILPQCVALFAAGGHEAALGVEQRSVACDGPVDILLRNVEPQFLRRQQRPAMKTLVAGG